MIESITNERKTRTALSVSWRYILNTKSIITTLEIRLVEFNRKGIDYLLIQFLKEYEKKRTQTEEYIFNGSRHYTDTFGPLVEFRLT